MHVPPHFAIKDSSVIDRFIKTHAFGQLTSIHQGRLCCSHMPFLYDPGKGLLTGHLGKRNPQHQDLEGQELLVTLQGAHGYISPSWYASEGVPTWNYQAVHLYGQGEVFHDCDSLKQLVDQLTVQFEQSQATPWTASYDERMLHGIVGIRIKVSSIEGQFKLNQNRSVADRQGVINHLDPSHQADLLTAMKQVL